MRRLRINITHVTPGYVTCSLFQSDNDVNWGCVGTGINFPEAWFEQAFGGVPLEVGTRVEFRIDAPKVVTG